MAQKKKLSAKAILQDTRQGLSDQDLMAKYQISEETLQSVFKKLLDAGVLSNDELEKRLSEPVGDLNKDSEILGEPRPSESTSSIKAGLRNIVSLVRNRQFKKLWQAYRPHLAVVAFGIVAIILSYVGYETLSLPYESDVPDPIEQRVVAHYANQRVSGGYSNLGSRWELGDIRVLKAAEGVPPKKLVDGTRPQKVYCVSLLAKVLRGKSEDPFSPRVLNVIVYEARSGKLTGTVLRKDDSEKESNCPDDWDNICTFTCDCHDELVVNLREQRRKALEEELARRATLERAEEARRREEQARKQEEEKRRREEQASKREEEKRKLEEQARREQDRKNAKLLLSASGGDVEAVRLSLSQGAEIEAKDKDGNTALMLGILANRFGVVKLLLENGANVNAINTDEKTPLIIASEMGKLQHAKTLLSKSVVHVNSRDMHGDTALMKALRAGHNEVAQLLLESGADVELGNISGESPLSLACETGNLSILKLMLEGEKLSWVSKNAALKKALNHRNMEVAALLLKHIADPDPEVIGSERGETLLTTACGKRDKDLVKLLLNSGINANQKNSRGNTALIEAVWSGYPEMVELLLEKGADPNVKSRKGNTAAMAAAAKGHVRILEMLLNKRSQN